MSFLSDFIERLVMPELRGLNPDDPVILGIQEGILKKRKCFRSVYSEVYKRCLHEESVHGRGDGIRVELGSGIGFIKQFDPGIIRSDVRKGKNIDMILDAKDMSFGEESVALLLGVHVFHHISSPADFFNEARRVLKPGAVLILVEPWYGPLASLIYRNVFKNEEFDKAQTSWFTDDSGPMTNANQALSYIVFKRDVSTFKEVWPELEIRSTDVFSNYLRYLFSGGLNFKRLLPEWIFGLLKGMEWVLYPFRRLLGLHQIIVITRKDNY